MAKNQVKVNANVVDTVRPRVAGAGRRPAVDALRSIATRVTAPLLPDDYLKLANPLWSARELRGRVIEVRRETEDSATLVIKPGWGFTFDYQPGQYIGIGLLVDGRWRWRSYSLTSSPVSTSRTISITVKAMPEGFLSTHLVGGVAPGTIVRLAAPQGEFVLPDPAPPSVLFLTAGSGITPVMSMLRTLHRRTHRGRITFLHCAQSPDHQIFAAELDEIRHSGHGTEVHLLHPELGDPNLSPAYLDRLVPGYRDVLTYACGPAPMIDAVRAVYDGSDVLRVEYFQPPRTSGTSAEGDVAFVRSGVEVANTGATLLEQAERAGLTPEFGCRMGICLSCTAVKRDGTVRNVLTGEESSLPDEEIRVCVNAPVGDCVVDL